MRNIQVSCSFDMRAPAWGTRPEVLYPAAIEMAQFADGIGVDRIGLDGASRLGRRLPAASVSRWPQAWRQ
jgi:hypothetical protein